MFSYAFHHLLTIYVCTTSRALGFEFPSSVSNDLALYSNISVTSTCDDTCTTGCPSRNDFPDKQTPLKSIQSSCKTFLGLPPSAAILENGGINFDETTTECVADDNTYSSVSPNYFTLTMWIKALCTRQGCDLFSIGNVMKMISSGSALRLNLTSKPVSPGAWIFITIRYNGAVTWFLDGQQVYTFTMSFPSTSYKLTLGPSKNLAYWGYIHMVDVRWYADALTDREVTAVFTGTLLDVGLKSECRCPATHPILSENTKPVKYMKCTDGNTEVLRLGKNMYIREYMLDNDIWTSWISEYVKETNITLSLGKQFQIKSISLEGIKHRPASLDIILVRNGKETKFTGNRISGETFTHNLEATSISKRPEYEKLVAEKVILQAKFTSSNYFTVSELKLEARCNCYGNDQSCSINSGTYTCRCISGSNTIHEHCETCKSKYYRDESNFICNHQCDCNTMGSIGIKCHQVGGQCYCRSNVEGRQCTKCKHNTAEFTNTGCTKCNCNPEGITSCGQNLTCNCKQNVESSSGKCETCLQNYYNITNFSGCTVCNCDTSGTMDDQPRCDNVTGVCHCKANVQERTCKVCKNQYFGLSAHKVKGCDACECNIVGSSSLVCDKDTGNCRCVDGIEHADDGNRQCTPKDLHLEPTYGPVAGGTLLTLTGTLLGSNATVSLSFDGSKQTLMSRNLTSIIFETKTGTEGEKQISLSWAYAWTTYHAEEIENKTRFKYKKNPVIIVPIMDIRSFASGGCIIRIQGSNLDSVPYPKMIVHMQNNQEEDSLCTAATAQLQCPTPNLGKYESNMTYSYGFRMDGYTNYENASAKHRTMLVVVPNPTVHVGTSETYRNTLDKIFKIKGERLHEACHDSDVTITLGDKNCALITRTQDSISCDPGEEFPGTTRTVKVKIKIGNFEKVVGELKINSFWKNTEFIYIIIGVGVFLILVIVLIVCICWCRNKSYRCWNLYTGQTETSDTHRYGRRQPYNETTHVAVVVPLKNKTPERSAKMIAEGFCDRLEKNVGKTMKTSLIEKSKINIGKICTHKGKRIRVLGGQYNVSTPSPNSDSNLTLKTLVKPYAEVGVLPEWLNIGLQECTRLQDFVNDNVLRIMGIAIDAKNVYILYPEMSNRTLKDYIEAAKEPMKADKKREICIQVADGMNYLSFQGVVHKDLAARNCWVSRDFEVKISDASFSYDLYPDEYLEKNGRFEPVRWMAPESLRQGFYDTQSDVWSYGVLVWEVYSNGSLPYNDIKSNKDIRLKICDEHLRLGKPSLDCPDSIFELIEDCHKDRSDDRPNFFIVENKFDSILNSAEQNLHLYENRAFTTTVTDNGLEDYVNTQLTVVTTADTDDGLEDYVNTQFTVVTAADTDDGLEDYVNTQFTVVTTVDTDDGLEDYVNTQFTGVPTRPPRAKKS